MPDAVPRHAPGDHPDRRQRRAGPARGRDAGTADAGGRGDRGGWTRARPGRRTAPARWTGVATYALPGLIDLHTDHLEAAFRAASGGALGPGFTAAIAHDAQVCRGGDHHRFRRDRPGFRHRRPGPGADARADGRRSPAGAGGRHAARGTLPAPALRGHRSGDLPADRAVRRRRAGALHVADGPHAGPAASSRTSTGCGRNYRRHLGLSDDEVDRYIEEQMARQRELGPRQRRALAEIGHARGVPLASHDDQTPDLCRRRQAPRRRGGRVSRPRGEAARAARRPRPRRADGCPEPDPRRQPLRQRRRGGAGARGPLGRAGVGTMCRAA